MLFYAYLFVFVSKEESLLPFQKRKNAFWHAGRLRPVRTRKLSRSSRKTSKLKAKTVRGRGRARASNQLPSRKLKRLRLPARMVKKLAAQVSGHPTLSVQPLMLRTSPTPSHCSPSFTVPLPYCHSLPVLGTRSSGWALGMTDLAWDWSPLG